MNRPLLILTTFAFTFLFGCGNSDVSTSAYESALKVTLKKGEQNTYTLSFESQHPLEGIYEERETILVTDTQEVSLGTATGENGVGNETVELKPEQFGLAPGETIKEVRVNYRLSKGTEDEHEPIAEGTVEGIVE